MEYGKLYSTNNCRYFKDSDFFFGLQQARLFNSFNMSRRTYFRILKDDNPINQRDHIECILLHGAIVYECINTLRKKRNRLLKLKSWNSSNLSINFIKKEIENKNSFSETILKDIRNKIVFHFDQNILEDIAKDYPFTEGTTLIEGSSDNDIEYYFPIIDKIVLTFLSKSLDAESSDLKVPSKIIEKLIEVSSHLAMTIIELTTDILHTYIKWE